MGGNVRSSGIGIWDFWELNSLELCTLGFWLHKVGCFRGLNVKNPAEKMWVPPRFRDLRWREEEVAVEATEQ